MNAIALTLTAFLVIIILFLPRRLAMLGIFSGVCYMTQGQMLVVGGISLTVVRVIEIAGIMRVLVRKEIKSLVFNEIDKAFLAFNSVYMTMFTMRYLVDASSQSGLMYRIGFFCDAIITYVIFRSLLKGKDEFILFLKDSVFLLVPFTVLMVWEGLTGRNIFHVFGGVPQTPILRGGYFRSQASFRHAITAGSVGATLMPLYVFLAVASSSRFIGFIGIILCATITMASHSSGPLMAFTFGVLAWLCWPLRGKMKKVRWTVAGSVLLLHMIMRAPVWFVLDRLSGVVGGDGWHRANLIDKFVTNVDKWWMSGMPLELTESWAATKMPWGSVDVTNEYVNVGLNGGLASLVLFWYLLVKCFKLLGVRMKEFGTLGMNSNADMFLLWGLGSTLLSHAVNLISVSYWDQFYVIWYLTLAAISNITAEPFAIRNTVTHALYRQVESALRQ